MATTRIWLSQSLAAALIIFSFLSIAVSATIPIQFPKLRNQHFIKGYERAKPTKMPNVVRKRIKTAGLVNEFVLAHNIVRLPIGHPPMIWNYTLAYYAKHWAKKRVNDCKLIHSNGPYGENLFWGLRSHWTPAEAVKLWVDEKAYYDRKTNTCAEGEMCGHYTQIIWRDSIRVGCARIQCYNGKGVFVICNYDPPGNYVNEDPFGDFLTGLHV